MDEDRAERKGIKQRLFERVGKRHRCAMTPQKCHGGWTYHKSIGRTPGQFLGIDSGRSASHTHATFLALYALTNYDS